VSPSSPFSLGGGLGAWELAARYSVADLNDNECVAGAATPVGGIRGGEQKITTVGLNWYPIKNVRMMFEYLVVDVEKLNGAGADIGQDHKAYATRVQFAF